MMERLSKFNPYAAGLNILLEVVTVWLPAVRS